jgi:two-component system cell cycle sensor histidine kinase/response regulator CckA
MIEYGTKSPDPRREDISTDIMRPPFNVLHLEDKVADRELTAAALAADGLECEFNYAVTQAEFLAALADDSCDVILSDFTLPSYTGLEALEEARRRRPKVPFLFLSGTLGEERAVASLKMGAADYVLKDHPDRLASAIRRALGECECQQARQAAEVQWHQDQKLGAIEQLARGMAHELNNQLSPVRAYAELLFLAPGLANEPSKQMLAEIITAVDRSADLIRRLGVFSRSQMIHPAPVVLNEVVAGLAPRLRSVLGEQIEMQLKYAAQLPGLEGDASLLQQAILNLASNARDAMPHGGVFYIDTAPVKVSPVHDQADYITQAGELVCLTIRDTGGGIQSEHLPHLFEPFFTTKPVGQGVGLGLATVYGIVQQHHGWIEVATRPGVGTEFKIFLPAGGA